MEDQTMLNKGSIFAGNRPPGSLGNGASPGALATNPAKDAPDLLTATKGDSLSPPPKAAEKTATVAKLVVGPGVKLKGAEIQDCDTLLVEGRVEAVMDSRYVEIADQGSFDGKVNIDVAEIHGRFSGELTAREQIVIHSTGRVSGKIRYGKIVVHEGGELSGDIKSLKAAENGDKSKDAAKDAAEDAATELAINRLMAKTA
jgi:cytoskeletal protein CcmA (bactofilin family)